MNKTNKKVSEAAKPAYESLACEVLELETQGVLCASNSEELTGGLNSYSKKYL